MDKSSYEERIHKCAHEQCECTVPRAEEYCCSYCSTADDVEEIEIQCGCGHDSCAGLSIARCRPKRTSREAVLLRPLPHFLSGFTNSRRIRDPWFIFTSSISSLELAFALH